MEWLALDARPQLKLIATAAAAETTVTPHCQVGDEVAWSITTVEETSASHAASFTFQRVEAD
jgi:hypothetical protein